MKEAVLNILGRREVLARLGALAVLAGTLGTMSFLRAIDGDEGFFLMAARLVSEGRCLYDDFFFLHAPMVPYTFGAWFKAFGAGWYTARLLAGAISVGLGLLIFEYVYRTTARWRWAFLTTAMYAAAGPVLGWFSPVKTLGISCLALFAGAWAVSLNRRLSSLWGGLLFGLAVSGRVYLIVAFLCGLLFLIRRDGWSRVLVRNLGLMAAGAIIGVLPLLISLIQDHQAFWFGTVEYHALRDTANAGVVGNWPQKWITLLSVLGIDAPDGPGSVQFLALVVLALASLVSRSTPRNSIFAYLWIALFLISLLPTPSYQQYFALLVPFLIVESVVLVSKLDVPPIRPVLVFSLLAYGVLGFWDAQRYVLTGAGVAGLWSADRIPRWSIPHVNDVAKAIDEQQLPVGASWWPGYFVSSRTPIVLELANDFGMVVADKVSEARRRQLHLVSHGEVARMIQKHDPQLFVEGNWTHRQIADALPVNGYVVVRTVDSVKIWTRRR